MAISSVVWAPSHTAFRFVWCMHVYWCVVPLLSDSHFLKRPYWWSYCFQAIARATVTTAKGVPIWHWSVGVFRQAGQEDRTRACAGVAFVTSGVADEVAHRVQRRKSVRMRGRLLLATLQRIPGKEDEEEAQELQARCQTEVNKSKGCDIVLPAGSMETAVLLPQHTCGVNHSSKINRSGDVSWREVETTTYWKFFIRIIIIIN